MPGIGCDFSAATLAPIGGQVRARYLGDHRAAWVLRQILAYPPAVNRLIRKACADKDFALTVGLANNGMTSPGLLLWPSLIAHYLFW